MICARNTIGSLAALGLLVACGGGAGGGTGGGTSSTTTSSTSSGTTSSSSSSGTGGAGGSGGSSTSSSSGTGGAASTSSSSSSGSMPCTNVFQGSFTIQNSIDVGTISPYCEITGNLIVQVSGLPSLALPMLQKVGGHISIYGDLTTLDLSALTSVGNFYCEAPQIGTVSLPSLIQAERIQVQVSGVSLPALQTVTTDIIISGNGPIDVSALKTVGASLILCGVKVAAPFSAPELTTVGQRLVAGGANQVTALDLPKLTSIGQGASPSNTPLLDLNGFEPCGTSGNAQLSQLNLPLLTNLGPSNAGNFMVAGTPLLPKCRIDVVVNHLVANGWTGQSIISPPNASGPCP